MYMRTSSASSWNVLYGILRDIVGFYGDNGSIPSLEFLVDQRTLLLLVFASKLPHHITGKADRRQIDTSDQLIIPTSLWLARLAEVVAAALPSAVPVPVPAVLLVVAELACDFEPLVVIESLALLEPDADSAVEAEVEAAIPCQI